MANRIDIDFSVGQRLTSENMNEIVAAINELNNMTSVTYSQLVELRDSSTLIPGMYYRVTDYVTTTTQANTQSAGHAFDVIVVADSEDVLNENARAIQHSGDTYFSESSLSEWELKYSIDKKENKVWSIHSFAKIKDNNDYLWHTRNSSLDFTYDGTTYYAWTDENGWTIYTETESGFEIESDEYRYYWYNGDSYSGVVSLSDNVLTIEHWDSGDSVNYTRSASDDMVKNPLDGSNGDNYYAWKNGDNIIYTTSTEPSEGDDYYYGDFYFDSSDSIQGEIGASSQEQTAAYKGIITHMKDEYNNEYPYDFKNIQYKRYKITECQKVPDLVGTYLGLPNGNGYSVDDTDYIWVYCCGGEEDETLTGTAYANVILNDNTGSLNNIVMGSGCYSNRFDGVECYDNTFGNYLQRNTFGNSCGGNTFGNNNFRNTFGNECYNNTFGNNIWYNTFGNYCSDNTFGNSCGGNTFGNDCYGNTFGNDFYYNTFGNNNNNNTFGNSCQYNTFGNYCYNNTFGNSCYENTFGNSCYWNTFGNGVGSNTFGNECYNNTFGNDYIRWCSFGDGVQYCSITGYSTGSSNYLQNIIVLNGTQGTNGSNLLSLSGLSVGVSYSQTCGRSSSGTYTHKNILD